MSYGEKIRTTRLNKGISLRKLAKEIGVSPSFISQVEQNKAQPSVTSLRKIADVLEVNCSYLIGEETNTEYSETLSKRKNIFEDQTLSNVTIKRLVPADIDNNLEPSLLSLAPGATTTKEISANTGEEFLLLLSGELEITLNEQKYTLHEGDNIYFSSKVKHSFRNVTDKTTKVLWVKAS